MSGQKPLDLGPGLRERILAAVGEGFAEQLELTRETVRHPSLRGQEHTVQDLLYRELASRGYAMDRWRLDPAALAAHEGASPVDVSYEHAINVVATHRPREERGRSLIVNGHVDVVPTGPLAMWARPPFEPVVEGGWLHGRGAGDMKAGLVAAIAALDALRRCGLQPAATLHLESVIEEESTGNGALACHQRGYRADAALIPEPTGEGLVRANLGVVWFRIEIAGRPVHVAQATTGANAIVASQRLVQALKELEATWNARRGSEPWFENETHPININVGKISGGDWASSVPSWCTLDCRAGFYPSMDPGEALAEIERCIAAASRDDPFLAENPPRIVNNGFRVRGYALEPGSEAEQLLAAAHGAVGGGAALGAHVMPAYLDARVTALYDRIPTLVYGPLAENIHGFDERVSLASLERVTGAMALFIAGWCGTEPV